jgi:hypothetical protein
MGSKNLIQLHVKSALNRTLITEAVIICTVRKLLKTIDPICERCLEDDESIIHILCDCEAVAHIRFRHLGQCLWNQVTTMAPP